LTLHELVYTMRHPRSRRRASESGTYQFPSVPIGTYTVTFELASFKEAAAPT